MLGVAAMDQTPFTASPAFSGGRLMPGTGRAQFGQGAASAMSMKWAALHDAAEAVGLLAGQRAESMKPEVRNFPAMMRDAGGRRCSMAERGIEDLTSIMEAGLSALLSAHARGAHPSAAALALWNEFVTSRDSLLALSPPKGPGGPMRRA